MPGPYAFKQIFAADPSNTSNVAKGGSVLLFAPGDASRKPLVLTDLSNGMTLPNPVPINSNGFGPAFLHESLPQVAWEGGGFSGTFESFEGLRADAVAAMEASQESAQAAGDARVAAEAAAGNAAEAAAGELAGAVAQSAAEATAAKVAAQQAAGLVDAPAGDAVLAAIRPGGAAYGALSGTYVKLVPDAPAITFSASQPIAGGVATPLTPSAGLVTFTAGDPFAYASGVKTALSAGSLGLRMSVYGKTAAVKVYCESSSGSIRVSIDGKVVTARNGIPIPSAANGYAVWVKLEFPTNGPHNLELFGADMIWQSVAHDSTGAISPWVESITGRRVVVIGDSWVGGALGVPTMNTWAAQLGEVMGINNAWLAGQGGTGYVATGPGLDDWTQDFGDARRLTKVIAAKPTDIIIFGSVNDSGKIEADIYNAAKALYSTLIAGLPAVKLHIVLAQPTTAANQNSVGAVANRRAVKTAAQESPNVYSIIDGVAANWLTDGNRPTFLGSDSVHPTQLGHDYFARMIGGALAKGFAPNATAFTPTVPVTVYASDSFTRADSATLGSTEVGGLPWSTQGGTSTILGNMLRLATVDTPAGGNATLIDTGARANYAIEVTIGTGAESTGENAGIAFRYNASADTGFMFYGSSGKYVLDRRNGGGAYAEVASVPAAAAKGDRLRVEVRGNDFTLKVNGATKITHTDATYSTQTRVGVFARYARTFDDFTVTSLS